jgi:hypothetical protein
MYTVYVHCCAESQRLISLPPGQLATFSAACGAVKACKIPTIVYPLHSTQSAMQKGCSSRDLLYVQCTKLQLPSDACSGSSWAILKICIGSTVPFLHKGPPKTCPRLGAPARHIKTVTRNLQAQQESKRGSFSHVCIQQVRDGGSHTAERALRLI